MASMSASEDDDDANFIDNVANTEEIAIGENVEIIEVTTMDIDERAVETDIGTNEDSSSMGSEFLDTESQMDLIDIPEEETSTDPPSFFPIRSPLLKQYTRRHSTPSVLVSDDCTIDDLPKEEALNVTPMEKKMFECLQSTSVESSKSLLGGNYSAPSNKNKSSPLRKVVVEKIRHLSTDEDSDTVGEFLIEKDILKTNKLSDKKPETHTKVTTINDASNQPLTDKNCDTAGDLDPQHSTIASTSSGKKSDNSETLEPLTHVEESSKQSESVKPLKKTVQSFKQVIASKPVTQTVESCEQSDAVETFEQTVSSPRTLTPCLQSQDGSETIKSPAIPENVTYSKLKETENADTQEKQRNELELVSQSKQGSQIKEGHKTSVDEVTALGNDPTKNTDTTIPVLNETNDESYEDIDNSLDENQALKTKTTRKKHKKQLNLLQKKDMRSKKMGKKNDDKNIVLEDDESDQTIDSSENLNSEKSHDKNIPSPTEKIRNSNVNKESAAEETSKESAVCQPESIKAMVENNITMNDINIEIMFQQLMDREMSDVKEICDNTDNSQSNSDTYVLEVAMPDNLDNTNEDIEASMLDNETEENVTNKPETISPRQRGRPRKYIKGQEPYRTPSKGTVNKNGRTLGRPKKIKDTLKPAKHFPKPARLHRGRPAKIPATKLSPPSPFKSPGKRGRPRKYPVSQTTSKYTFCSLYKMRKLKSALRESGDVTILKMFEKESFKGFVNTKESFFVSPQSVSAKSETDDINKPVTEIDDLSEADETPSSELSTKESASVTTEETVSTKEDPKDTSLTAEDRISKLLALLEADTNETLLEKLDTRKQHAKHTSSSSLKLLQSLRGIRPLHEDTESKEDMKASPVASRPRGRPRKLNVFKSKMFGNKSEARKRMRQLKKKLKRVRGKKSKKNEEVVADIKEEVSSSVTGKPSQPKVEPLEPTATQPAKRGKPLFDSNVEISAILDKNPDFQQFYACRTSGVKSGTHILGGKKKRKSPKDEERRFWSLWFEWKSLKPAEKKKYDTMSDSMSTSSISSGAGNVVSSTSNTYSRQFPKQRQAGLLLTGDTRICFLCLKGGRQEQLLRCKGRCQQTYHSECVRLVVQNPSYFATPKKKKGRKRIAGLPEGVGASSVKRLKLGDGTPSEVTSSADSLAPPNAPPTDTTDSICCESLSSDPSVKSHSSNTDLTVSLKGAVSAALSTPGGEIDHHEVADIDFLCHLCRAGGKQPCFICNDAAGAGNSAAGNKVRCRFPRCYKLYHEACLSDNFSHCRWSNGTLQSCPCHVCHMCASDNPSTALLGSHDKYLRCVRCPSTYHATMSCVPAGTRILSLKHALCPLHISRRNFVHFNTNWCFICSNGAGDKSGDKLLCCARCPVAVHAQCCVDDASKYDEAHPYVCDDCKGGRFPLYGEVVWVRYGHFRWWPGQILFPEEIPDNLIAKCEPGVFVVYFFGTHNYAHVCKGQAYVFEEGDDCHSGVKREAGGKKKELLDGNFATSLEEAREAFEEFQRNRDRIKVEETIERETRPAKYVKIKTNKPVGSVRVEVDKSSTPVCECDPASEAPCGFNSNCINRDLYVECNPELCRSRSNCRNQDFERRNYPPLEVFNTQTRGWGLKSSVDLHRGQFVVEYVGEMIDQEELNRRRRDMEKNSDHNYYFLSLDNSRYIDAGVKGNLARFMNHSCEPNCTAEKWTVSGDTRVGLFTLKDIPAGTELVFNYELQKGDKDEMRPCMCGAGACSGFIGAKKQEEKAGPGKETRKGLKAKRRNGRLGTSQSASGKLVVCTRCEEECSDANSVTCAMRRCRASYHTSCVVGLSNTVGGLIGTSEASVGAPVTSIGTPGSTFVPGGASSGTSDMFNTPVSTKDSIPAGNVANDTPTSSADVNDISITCKDISGTPSTSKDISATLSTSKDINATLSTSKDICGTPSANSNALVCGLASPSVTSSVGTPGDVLQGKWICPLHGCTTCKKTSRPTVKCKYCNGSYCKDHRNHLCYDISPHKALHPSDAALVGADANLSLTEREKRTLRRNCGATSKEEIDNYLRIVNVREELEGVTVGDRASSEIGARAMSENRRKSTTKSRTPSSEDETTSGASVTSGRDYSADVGGCSSLEGGSVKENSEGSSIDSNEILQEKVDIGGRSILEDNLESVSVQENSEGNNDSSQSLKENTGSSFESKNDKTKDSTSWNEFSSTGDLSQSEVDNLESDKSLHLREESNVKKPRRRVKGRFVKLSDKEPDEKKVREIVDENQVTEKTDKNQAKETVEKDVGSERKINKVGKNNQEIESEVSTEIKNRISEEPMDVDNHEGDSKESIDKVDESFEEVRHRNLLNENKKNVSDTCIEVVKSVRKSKRKSKLNIDKNDSEDSKVDLSVQVVDASENLKENSDANIANVEVDSMKIKRSKRLNQVGIEKEPIQHFLATPSDTDNNVEGEFNEKDEKVGRLDDIMDTRLSPEKLEKYLEEHNIVDCNVSLDHLNVSADALKAEETSEEQVEGNVLEVSSTSQSTKTRTRAQKHTESKDRDENNSKSDKKAKDDSNVEEKNSHSNNKEKDNNSKNDPLVTGDASVVSSENVQKPDDLPKGDKLVTSSQAKPKASVLKELRTLMIDMVEPANSHVINSVLEGNLSPSERPKRKSVRSKQNTESEPKKDDVNSPKKVPLVKKTVEILENEKDASKLEGINDRMIANQALVLLSPLKPCLSKTKSRRNLESTNAKETKSEDFIEKEVTNEVATVNELNTRSTRKSTKKAEALESTSSVNAKICLETYEIYKPEDVLKEKAISEASTVSEPNTRPTRKSIRKAEAGENSLSSTNGKHTKISESQKITENTKEQDQTTIPNITPDKVKEKVLNLGEIKSNKGSEDISESLKKNTSTRRSSSPDNSTKVDAQARRSLRQKLNLEVQITNTETLKDIKHSEKEGKVDVSETSENTLLKDKKKVVVSLMENVLVESNVKNVFEKIDDVVDEMSSTRRKSSRIISSVAKNESKVLVSDESSTINAAEITENSKKLPRSTENDKNSEQILTRTDIDKKNEQTTRLSQLDKNRSSKKSLPWIGEKKLLNISNDEVQNIHSTVITNQDISDYICSKLETADVSQNARNFAKTWGTKSMEISEKDVIRNVIEIMSILKTVPSDLSFLEVPGTLIEMFNGFEIDQSPKNSLFRSKKLEKTESEFRQKLLQKYGSICKAPESEKLSSLENIQNKLSTLDFSKEQNLLREKRRSARLSVELKETDSIEQKKNTLEVQIASKGEEQTVGIVKDTVEKSVVMNVEKVEAIDGTLQPTSQSSNKPLLQTNRDLVQDTGVDETSQKVKEVSKPVDEQLKSCIENKTKASPVCVMIKKTETSKYGKKNVMKVSEKGLPNTSIGQILFSELKRKEMKQSLSKALINEQTNDVIVNEPLKKASVSELAMKEHSETSKEILTNESKVKSVGEPPKIEPTRKLTTKDTTTSPSKEEIESADLEVMMMNIHKESEPEKSTKINDNLDKIVTTKKQQSSPNENNNLKSVAEKAKDGETKLVGDKGETETNREKVKKRKISFSAEVMEKTRDQPEVKKRKISKEPSRVKPISKEKELIHADEKENVLKKIMQEEQRELERIQEKKKAILEAGVKSKLTNDKKVKRKEAFRHDHHKKLLKKFPNKTKDNKQHSHDKKPQGEHARLVENRDKQKHKHERPKPDEKSASLKANKSERIPEKPSPSKKESHKKESHDTIKHRDKRKESEKSAHRERPTVTPRSGEDKVTKDKNERTPEKKNEKTSSEPSSREKSVSQPVGSEQKKSPVTKPSETKPPGPPLATGPNPKKAGPKFFLEDLESSMANYYVDLAKKKKEKLAKKNQQIHLAKASGKTTTPTKSGEAKLVPATVPSGSAEKKTTPEHAPPGKRLKFSPDSQPSPSSSLPAPPSCTIDLPPKKNLLKKYTFHHDVGVAKPATPSELSKSRPGGVSNLCTLNTTPPKQTDHVEKPMKCLDPRTSSSPSNKNIPVSRWTPVVISESPAKYPTQGTEQSRPMSVASDRKPSSHAANPSVNAKPKVRFSFTNYPLDVESSATIPGQTVAKATLPVNVNNASSVSMTTETRIPPAANKAPLIDPSFFSPVKSHSNLPSQKSSLNVPPNTSSLKSHSNSMSHSDIPQGSHEFVSNPLSNLQLPQKTCVEKSAKVSPADPVITLGNPTNLTKSTKFEPPARQGTKMPNLQALCRQEFHTLSPENEKSSLCSIM